MMTFVLYALMSTKSVSVVLVDGGSIEGVEVKDWFVEQASRALKRPIRPN